MRGEGGSEVAQQLDPELDGEGTGPQRGPVPQAVVAGVGFAEVGEALDVGAEVEGPAVDDDTPDRGPVSPRNLVAEWTTMSAPCSMGRSRYGVGTVLSAISGTPASWATSATARMSSTLPRGLPSVSANNALVSGRTAARQASMSSGSSTKVTSMPNLGSV